jgi:Asp-tRNA(Asn)/Glu-tRNA(Gln) amidotransferase C subunit
VQPTSSVAGRHLTDRPDEVQPSIDREEALAAAPDAAVNAGFFRVPRVLG